MRAEIPQRLSAGAGRERCTRVRNVQTTTFTFGIFHMPDALRVCFKNSSNAISPRSRAWTPGQHTHTKAVDARACAHMMMMPSNYCMCRCRYTYIKKKKRVARRITRRPGARASHKQTEFEKYESMRIRARLTFSRYFAGTLDACRCRRRRRK